MPLSYIPHNLTVDVCPLDVQPKAWSAALPPNMSLHSYMYCRPRRVHSTDNQINDANHDATEFSVWVSLVQLYNEQLYDMLRDPQRVHPLAIHEQPEAGIYVQGLSEYAVHSAGECLQLLRVGSEHR